MNQQGKRDFGSFHASNVQELLHIPESEYEPPPVNVTLPTFHLYETGTFQFGKVCRKNHFLLEDFIFLNHGAFGGVLKEALEVAQAWQVYIERQPLRFFDRELLPLLAYVTRRLAKFVKCEPTDLVLVPNVTTAVNCVLRSQQLKPGDKVFSLSTEYGGVKKMLRQICLERGATWQEEKVTLPLKGKQEILDLVQDRLQEGTVLLVVDHIPSNTPFIMPIKEIIEICHSRNIQVLIDGAHALGALDLDLNALGADYYTSNAHKWFSAPKGAAFMYVHPKHQASTRPLVISHGYGSGFNSEFIWSGLRDYSPFLALLTVLDFWETVGADKLRAYMHNLAQQAGKLLTEKWKTQLLAPTEMFGSMMEVELPSALHDPSSDINYGQAEAIQNMLFHKYNIEVPVKAVAGKLWVRLSAHIYNELVEYEQLGDAINQHVQDLEKEGQHQQ